MPSVGIFDFGVNGGNASKVGGTGTGVKYFPRLLGASIGVAPLTPSSTSAVGSLLIGGPRFNSQFFEVYVAGTTGPESGDPSGTVTVQLYAVTGSFASPTYTSIGTTGAVTPNVAAAQDWGMKFNLLMGASGTLGGNYVVIKNGVPVASAATTNVISGLNVNKTGNAGLNGATVGLVVGVTFGTSDSTNTASLFQFVVE